MSRPKRCIPAGSIVHGFNRGAHRLQLFQDDTDYLSFLVIAAWAAGRSGVKVLAYCVMPNHWHFLLQSVREGDVTQFFFLLTSVHARSWRARHGTTGGGCVYQDRYKAVLIEDGAHCLFAWRYVERNALRANLARRAEDWKWGSAAQRTGLTDHEAPALSTGPVELPADWLERVNAPQTPAEEQAMQRALRRNLPFGSPAWCRTMAKQTGRTLLLAESL